jgi:hypothetical protein
MWMSYFCSLIFKQYYWDFGLWPSSKISHQNTFQELDVSSLRWKSREYTFGRACPKELISITEAPKWEVDWLWWSETNVSELRPPQAYCSSPGDLRCGPWYHDTDRLTPNLSTRALWQPPALPGSPAIKDISEASGRVGKGNENLVYPYPWDFKRSFTCCKILWHGTSGFTSHPKERVLRIFIALKNPSPWPGSNPQPLGSEASTLTSTPPRRQVSRYSPPFHLRMETNPVSETCVLFRILASGQSPETQKY